MNSALTYYCHFGDRTDDRLQSILMLLVHLIKEPAFSQLRTVEQLGYVFGQCGVVLLHRLMRSP